MNLKTISLTAAFAVFTITLAACAAQSANSVHDTRTPAPPNIVFIMAFER